MLLSEIIINRCRFFRRVPATPCPVRTEGVFLRKNWNFKLQRKRVLRFKVDGSSDRLRVGLACRNETTNSNLNLYTMFAQGKEDNESEEIVQSYVEAKSIVPLECTR
jgi:hypothetical protein